MTLKKDANIEEIEIAYKNFKHEFDKFNKKFNSQIDILKHSTHSISWTSKNRTTYTILNENGVPVSQMTRIADMLRKIENINKACKNIEDNLSAKNTYRLVSDLNILNSDHKNLVATVGEMEKKLPFVQTIRLYLHKAVDLLSKLCAAVTKFLTKTVPERARDAKKSITASFSNFRTAAKDDKAIPNTVDRAKGRGHSL